MLLLTLASKSITSKGSKIAVNDKLIATVHNNQHQLIIQFASATTPCISNISNSSFVYSIASGRHSNRTSLAYIAEDLITYQLLLSSTTIYENCTFDSLDLFVSNFTHGERILFAVDPTGQFLFGFLNKSIFIWEPDTQESELWSMNSTSIHSAVDINYEFIVLTGYIDSNTPVAHLIDVNSCDAFTTSNSCMTIVDTFIYNSSKITNMSVKIDDTGHVLWSIGSKVILFNITHSRFELVNTLNISSTIRALAWMDNNTFAVLISSQVLFYSIGLTLLSTFPNTWKTLCPTMILNFDTIAWSDVIGLAITDVNGSAYIIQPTTPGYYSVTGTGCEEGIPFAFSNQSRCPPGSYHFETSSRPCALCPQGTFNNGNHSAACILCNDSSFCPLGAVADVNNETMNTILQAYAYPKSPDSTIFDDILLQNIFSLNFSRHCLLVSPLFWALLVMIITLLLFVSLGTCKCCIRCRNIRQKIKDVFKQTDLIGEGTLWVGGMVSISVIVLVVFAYVFSALYLRQYPIETASNSSFTCNPSLRNSQFSSQMQILGIPLNEDIQPMFDMLDAQPYTLNIDFVNTLFTCQYVIVQQTVGLVVTLISPQNCSYHDAILSVSIALPTHTIAIQVVLNGTLTVGGIRVGLSGPEAVEGNEYRVQELGFKQSYSVLNRVLAQNPSLQLIFIRLINSTEPLTDGQNTIFSALWIPTFSYVSDQLFLTETQFVGNMQLQTMFSVSLSEKAYYVLNTQTPIAKEAEIVFHSILFTIVCLELFGLLFLIFKLLFVPFFKRIGIMIDWIHPSEMYLSTKL